MSAAVPHRSGAAPVGSRPAEARRPKGNPWVVELRELGRRAGSMQEWDRTLPAPAGWRIEVIGVPEGAPVHLDLRLESRVWPEVDALATTPLAAGLASTSADVRARVVAGGSLDAERAGRGAGR